MSKPPMNKSPEGSVSERSSADESTITAPVNLGKEVVAMILSNVGDIRCQISDFDNAFIIYNDVHQIRKAVLGEDHLETILAAFNAGKCLHCLRKSDAAIQYYATFKTAISSSPNNGLLNKKTITALQSIAWMFHQERSYDHAKEYYELAHKSTIQVFGESHKITARILNQCGNLNFEFGQMEYALHCYKQGLAIEHALGPSGAHSHIDILTTLSNIAHAYEVIGNAQQSLEFSEKIVIILKSNDGSMTHSSRLKHAAGVFLDIARLQDSLGRPNKALQALTDALHIQRQEYGDGHGCVAVTLNEMGIIHGNLGQTRVALKCFGQSLRIRQILNDSDLTISPVLFNIARSHLQNADYSLAIAQYESIFDLEMRVKENADRDFEWSPDALLDALEHMADVYHSDLNEIPKALECYEKGIQLFMEIGNAMIPLGIQSRFLGMAGNINFQLGNVDRAIRLFSQTMRINLAAGWAFNANINGMGFDFLDENNDPPSGAPAA